jgi:peptidyl-prolyl cis-trans isomerase B (cyclophilin B)
MLLAGLALAACGDDGEDESSSLEPRSGESAPAETQPADEAEAAPAGCEQVEAPEPKEEGGQSKPKDELDPARTYTATVRTNCGTFEFELDVEAAPKATASVVFLAEEKFYDGTVFHRIVPDFVIQGGDPTGTGTGGPGYKTRDKPASDTRYTKGVVAMAKGGTEPAGTAGSQFFVVTGPGGAQLTPDYAVIGEITKGQKVVDRIGALGGPDEQPTATVVIEKLTVDDS